MNDQFDEFDKRLDRLLERLREETVGEDEVAELERDLQSDPELRRRYRARILMEEELSSTFEEPTEVIFPFESQERNPWFRRATVALIGLAASVALLAFWTHSSSENPRPSVATLESRSAAMWEIPPIFADGLKVGPGEVRLESGIARFRFDSGAIVSLEGPASLIIETPMKARLVDGKALVEVPEPGAKGFVLELPHGKAVDLGTRFSVTVEQDNATCEVLEGRVLMRHTASLREEELDDGQVMSLSGAGFAPLDYRPSLNFAPQVSEPLVLRSNKETTAVFMKMSGRPREQFVDDRMLLVKMEPKSMAQRRALFNIDLRKVRASQIETAKLNLNLVPSGLGFVAYLPEKVTFAIYGITDESKENWPAEDPRWEDLPGCIADDPRALNSAEVALLGKFEIDRGQQRGRCTIETEQLRDFLRSDTTGIAGFLIVRETYGTGNYSLVHAFASSHHPEASGPSLELTLADSKKEPDNSDDE